MASRLLIGAAAVGGGLLALRKYGPAGAMRLEQALQREFSRDVATTAGTTRRGLLNRFAPHFGIPIDPTTGQAGTPHTAELRRAVQWGRREITPGPGGRVPHLTHQYQASGVNYLSRQLGISPGNQPNLSAAHVAALRDMVSYSQTWAPGWSNDARFDGLLGGLRSQGTDVELTVSNWVDQHALDFAAGQHSTAGFTRGFGRMLPEMQQKQWWLARVMGLKRASATRSNLTEFTGGMLGEDVLRAQYGWDNHFINSATIDPYVLEHEGHVLDLRTLHRVTARLGRDIAENFQIPILPYMTPGIRPLRGLLNSIDDQIQQTFGTLRIGAVQPALNQAGEHVLTQTTYRAGSAAYTVGEDGTVFRVGDRSTRFDWTPTNDPRARIYARAAGLGGEAPQRIGGMLGTAADGLHIGRQSTPSVLDQWWRRLTRADDPSASGNLVQRIWGDNPAPGDPLSLRDAGAKINAVTRAFEREGALTPDSPTFNAINRLVTPTGGDLRTAEGTYAAYRTLSQSPNMASRGMRSLSRIEYEDLLGDPTHLDRMRRAVAEESILRSMGQAGSPLTQDDLLNGLAGRGPSPIAALFGRPVMEGDEKARAFATGALLRNLGGETSADTLLTLRDPALGAPVRSQLEGGLYNRAFPALGNDLYPPRVLPGQQHIAIPRASSRGFRVVQRTNVGATIRDTMADALGVLRDRSGLFAEGTGLTSEAIGNPLFQRALYVNDQLARAGLGLPDADLTSPLNAWKNLLLYRALPAAGATAAAGVAGYAFTRFLNRDDDPNQAGPGANIRANLSLIWAGISQVTGWNVVQRGLIEYVPGMDNLLHPRSVSEQREWLHSGYEPVRTGEKSLFDQFLRPNLLGRDPVYGGKTQYYRPNWYARAAADVEYSNTTLTRAEAYSPRRLIDPYYWERKHAEDRPYPVSGQWLPTSNSPILGPVVTLLNGTLGNIIKPARVRNESQQWVNEQNVDRRLREGKERQNGPRPDNGLPVTAIAASLLFGRRSTGDVTRETMTHTLASVRNANAGAISAGHREPRLRGLAATPAGHGLTMDEAIHQQERQGNDAPYLPLMEGTRERPATNPGSVQNTFTRRIWGDLLRHHGRESELWRTRLTEYEGLYGNNAWWMPGDLNATDPRELPEIQVPLHWSVLNTRSESEAIPPQHINRLAGRAENAPMTWGTYSAFILAHESGHAVTAPRMTVGEHRRHVDEYVDLMWDAWGGRIDRDEINRRYRFLPAERPADMEAGRFLQAHPAYFDAQYDERESLAGVDGARPARPANPRIITHQRDWGALASTMPAPAPVEEGAAVRISPTGRMRVISVNARVRDELAEHHNAITGRAAVSALGPLEDYRTQERVAWYGDEWTGDIATPGIGYRAAEAAQALTRLPGIANTYQQIAGGLLGQQEYERTPAMLEPAHHGYGGQRNQQATYINEIRNTMPCLLPDTEVLLADGTTARAEDVQIGERLISKDGEPVTVLNVGRFPSDRKVCITLYGDNLHTTEFSPNHPIYLSDHVFHLAEDVRAGRYVAYPIRRYSTNSVRDLIDLSQYITTGKVTKDHIYYGVQEGSAEEHEIAELYEYDIKQIPLEIKRQWPKLYDVCGHHSTSTQPLRKSRIVRYWRPEDLYYLLGVYAAEGSWSNLSRGFSLAGHVNDKWELRVKQIFDRYDVSYSVQPAAEGVGQKVCSFALPLAEVLHVLCPGDASTKLFHTDVLRHDRDRRALVACLAGLIDGDGYYINTADGRVKCGIHTISPMLAYQFRNIVVDCLQIAPALTAERRGGLLVAIHAVSSGVAAQALAEAIGYTLHDYTPKQDNTKQYHDDTHVYIKVRSVEIVHEPCEVIGHCVTGDSTFCTATMATHNTWMPGADYFIDFQHGDPYAKVKEGHYRLPGGAYERLHHVRREIDAEDLAGGGETLDRALQGRMHPSAQHDVEWKNRVARISSVFKAFQKHQSLSLDLQLPLPFRPWLHVLGPRTPNGVDFSIGHGLWWHGSGIENANRVYPNKKGSLLKAAWRAGEQAVTGWTYPDKYQPNWDLPQGIANKWLTKTTQSWPVRAAFRPRVSTREQDKTARNVRLVDPEHGVSMTADLLLSEHSEHGRWFFNHQHRAFIPLLVRGGSPSSDADNVEDAPRAALRNDEAADTLAAQLAAHITGAPYAYLSYPQGGGRERLTRVVANNAAVEQAHNKLAQVRAHHATMQYGEDYSDLDKFRVLADVAPYSAQYKFYANRLSQDLTPSSNDWEEFQQIKGRASKVKKQTQLYPYKFNRAHEVHKHRVTVDRVLDANTFTTLEDPEHPIRFAGIRLSNTMLKKTGAKLTWQDALNKMGVAPGARLAVLGNTEYAKDQLDTERAVVYKGFRNVNRELLKRGWARPDHHEQSAAEMRLYYNGFQRMIGRIGEWFSHLDTPLHTKLLKVRSPLEEYKRSHLYGKTGGSWRHPVRDWLIPTVESQLAKHPLASAIWTGLLAGAFVRKGPALPWAMGLGAAAGFLGSLAVRMGTSKRKPWIPRRRRKEWELQEYFDALDYVKARKLERHYSARAEKEEGINVDQLMDEAETLGRRRRREQRILQRRKKKALLRGDKDAAQDFTRQLHEIDDEVEVRGLTPLAAKAMAYRQAAKQTMFGIEDDATIDERLSALPKNHRQIVSQVLSHGSHEEKDELATLLSPAEQRVIGTQLRQGADAHGDAPGRRDLVEYFKSHFLPRKSWRGWGEDQSLEPAMAKEITRIGLDPRDVGPLFHQEMNSGMRHPLAVGRYDRRRAGLASTDVRNELHSILSAHLDDLNVDVDVQPAATARTTVHMHLRHDRDEDLDRYMNAQGRLAS